MEPRTKEEYYLEEGIRMDYSKNPMRKSGYEEELLIGDFTFFTDETTITTEYEKAVAYTIIRHNGNNQTRRFRKDRWYDLKRLEIGLEKYGEFTSDSLPQNLVEILKEAPEHIRNMIDL